MSDIEKLLHRNDKADLIDFVNTHLPEADKCVVIFTKSDNKGGLVIFHCAVGFEFEYEFSGFLDMFKNFEREYSDE